MSRRLTLAALAITVAACGGSDEGSLDHTYPLDEIANAYRYVETGQKVGNVVIAM